MGLYAIFSPITIMYLKTERKEEKETFKRHFSTPEKYSDC